ncbi:MAG TPA: class I SAM-dependent RNA methyltransferase [Pyrinomonadaceae bacterium]|nr:class I SAM-dependent RNA methyltransferase [Pyrinomonadaceae bacterium]
MEVTIERILPGGLGLAHADGRTVMVALAAPGDRLRVRVERVKGSVAFASIEEIIEPSPDRSAPPCPYFGRCGGCDFQQMNYETQLAAKKEIIRDCLHRIAKIDAPDFQIVAAPNQWHYRSRAQWQFDADGKRLGYFESGSRRVCDVTDCAVLVPELQWVLEDMRAGMADESLASDARYFRAIAGDGTAVVAAGFERAHRTSHQQPAHEHSASSTEEEIGEVTRTIAGETYRLGAESFFQTNVDLLPQLIEEAIGQQHGDTAVELYCGVGLFTVPLARRFKDVTGVEDDADATEFAQQNLAHADLSNAEVEKSDVGNWLARNEHNPRFAPLDFVLLDPPRAGAESRVISGILKLKPKRLCYVSCDPATLARDLSKIIAGGYSLDSILAFDMFPQTHHVETVVHLSG